MGRDVWAVIRREYLQRVRSRWFIAAASTLSAVWIIIANGWMQHPVGFDIVNGRAELVDFWAVVTNKFRETCCLNKSLPTSSAVSLLTIGRDKVNFFIMSFLVTPSFANSKTFFH